jgi:NTP pyrophosphatase (non-canonical NTP hydrolase)
MIQFKKPINDVLVEVGLERMRQDAKWGVQRHSYGAWLAILVEEVGEVAQAMQKGMVSQKDTDADDLFKELIQVAAVASAIAEQIKEEAVPDGQES